MQRYPAFPIELGYMNKAEAEKLTLDDIEEALQAGRPGAWEIESVSGFVQVKPRSQREGIKFPEKRAGSNARKNNRGTRKRRI